MLLPGEVFYKCQLAQVDSFIQVFYIFSVFCAFFINIALLKSSVIPVSLLHIISDFSVFAPCILKFLMFSRVLFSFCNSLLSSISQVNSGSLGLPKLLALFHQCSLLGSTYIILFTTVRELFKTVSRGDQRPHLIYILFLGNHYALLTNP